MIVVGMENAESNIHSTAIVHPNAKLGKDVIVGPGAVIGEHVEIGDGTQIGAHVVIGGWTTIGKRCEIYPNASIGLEPQDLKFKGEKSYCNIGDETVIREFVTIIAYTCFFTFSSSAANSYEFTDNRFIANITIAFFAFKF